MSKKYVVVKHDEEEKKIVLKKEDNKFVVFWKNYNKNILLALFLLGIIAISIAGYITFSILGDSSEPKYKDMDIDFNGDDEIEVDNGDNNSVVVDNNNAQRVLEEIVNNTLKTEGEALVNKFINKKNLSIWFLSDGSVLMKKNGKIYRVSARSDGSYGVDEQGNIKADAYSRELTITKTKDYSFGKVEYYSDGSAMILSDKDSMFVRRGSDITEDYVSDSEVSYIKETKKIGSYDVIYYNSGLINIIGKGVDYVVHKDDDFQINGNDIVFNNGNEGTLLKEVSYNNTTKIRYYSDGSAIIFKNNNYVGVRRSNSIVIENNNFIEIVDNINVKKTKTKQLASGVVDYYDNGSAIIRYNSNEIIYVPNNEDIRYESDHISSVAGDAISRTELKKKESNSLEYFNDVVHVTYPDGSEVIAGKDKVNADGFVNKDLEKKIGTYTITNNEDKVLHYRLVLEKSDKTTVDPKFVNYVLEVNSDVKQGTITDNVWSVGSALSGGKTLGKESYILYEGTLDSLDQVAVDLMIYFDYEDMTNDMMDKWFIGTFRVYGWEEN